MRKLIIVMGILSILLGCTRNGCTLAPSKMNYLRIGLTNGLSDDTETYIRVEGSSKFEIKYGNLCQSIYTNCSEYDVIAREVKYFSLITEEEYNKHYNLNKSESTDSVNNLDSILLY
jgi:hypothetical protein